jgi:hypothetical protein
MRALTCHPIQLPVWMCRHRQRPTIIVPEHADVPTVVYLGPFRNTIAGVDVPAQT